MTTVEKLNELYEENFDEIFYGLPPLECESIVELSGDVNTNQAIGCIKDVTGINVNNSGGICRIIIGYTASKRAENNKMLFNYLIGLLLNGAMKAFTKEVGPLHLRKFRIHTYEDGNYFRELEMSAGIEFKIILEEKNG